MTYNEDMKRVTTREFVRKFGSLKGETFIVMDRTKPIGTYTPYDEKADRMTKSEERMTSRMTNVTTPVQIEDKPVAKSSVIEQLRAKKKGRKSIYRNVNYVNVRMQREQYLMREIVEKLIYV